ncbi:NAD(P)/FAD-dependent oxidoreductase [Zhouia sp. PK063]|uniref:NAD(P)/FAD-dependent oxidoreductase n=1 Tax=Zhouia sp. PK063 TaxID=3373602 RepID=UPI00379BEA6F
MVDYIIVGAGLAGICFSEWLEQHDKTFVVFDDSSQTSSHVAGGMYNPVILKRFTPVWKSEEQLTLLNTFYSAIEAKLHVKIDQKIKTLRRFTSIEEQNMWFEAADKPGLSPFINTKLHKNTTNAIHADFGFGEVFHTGRVHTKLLQEQYIAYLKSKKKFAATPFNYDALLIENELVKYKDVTAKKIVFAEGYGLKQNPFFNYLPLNGTKGELLIIHCPELQIEYVLKSSIFLIPLEDDHYLVGATYKWKDKTNTPTEEAKQELLEKLESFLKVPYRVVAHKAGIRPTVADRRPLVGQHPKYKNMYVLNGFGSRGVMIGPYVSKQLFDLVEYQIPLKDSEIDIQRYHKKYTQS